MKTRVQSSHVASEIRKMKKKSNLRAFRVDLEMVGDMRIKYFSEYIDAVKYASRMANMIIGKAHIYENVGGMEFSHIISYECGTPLPKNQEPRIKKVNDFSVGFSSDQRWIDAFNRKEVTIMIRRRSGS